MINAELAYQKAREFYSDDTINTVLNNIYDNCILPAINNGHLSVKGVSVPEFSMFKDSLIYFAMNALINKGYHVEKYKDTLNISWDIN